MSKKKTLTEGHTRGVIKGDIKPGTQLADSASQKPSGAPPAPQPSKDKK